MRYIITKLDNTFTKIKITKNGLLLITIILSYMTLVILKWFKNPQMVHATRNNYGLLHLTTTKPHKDDYYQKYITKYETPVP